MYMLQIGLAALLLVSAISASEPLVESERDQYKAHKDVPHPLQLLTEATDRSVDVHQSLGGNLLIKIESNKNSKKPHQSQSSSPEHQMGNEAEVSKRKADFTDKTTEPRGKRQVIDGSRFINQLYYNSWTPHPIVQVPPLQAYSLWQPQLYQISRPYVIPIWGSPGRIPIYFPPQPLFVNPGYPIDNPPRKYLPPQPPLPPLPDRGYLPTAPNATTTLRPNNDSTTVETESKFGDNGPVWDFAPSSMQTTTTARPTRRTRRPGQSTTTQPPLVRTTARPGSVNNQLQNEGAAFSPENVNSVIRPPLAQQRPPMVTQRPSIPQPAGRQPSRCVWAIISCCSAASSDVSYSCFEQLGCTGAFWDASPCESDFARAAIENVMNYYNTN